MFRRISLSILVAFLCTAGASEAAKLTLQLSGMDPHVGQMFEARVYDRGNGREIGRVRVDAISGPSFEVSIDGAPTGRTYRIDFYADMNGNGRYDTPPADHAWRVVATSLAADRVMTFKHNTNFVKIMWPDLFRLSLTGMTPHVGQKFELRVVNKATSREVGRVQVASIAAADFSVFVPGIRQGQSYQVDFYADMNGNGRYDTPPADHAWRMQVDNVQGNVTREFAHNTTFTPISWNYQYALQLTNMGTHNLNLPFQMRVVNEGTGLELGRVALDRIVQGTFTVFVPGIRIGQAYRADFFVDQNLNGIYTPPPKDFAWRMNFSSTEGDVAQVFTFNQDFVNIEWQDAPATPGRPIVPRDPKRHTAVKGTVTRGGTPVAGALLRISRFISGRPADYKWQGITDANGVATIAIHVDPLRFLKSGAAGQYKARAVNLETGAVIGEWFFGLTGEYLYTVSFPVGASAKVEGREVLFLEEEDFGLSNQPNPFNPSTQISYRLPEASEVSLIVYNLMGQEVRRLVGGYQAAGAYQVAWDGRDALGRSVSSGVYVYRLMGRGFVQTQRMMLLK